MAEPSMNQIMQHLMQVMNKQQEIIEKLSQKQLESKVKVEGLKLPTYSGRSDESARLYWANLENDFWRKERNAKRSL